MKLVIAVLTSMLLAVPAVRANAESVDCEPARCTVQASTDLECPCAEAKNHGRYTSCVKKVINRLVREGSVPKKCRSEIQGCAIRSICGKRDGSVACQLPGSPVTSRCRPLSSAAACTDRGGSVVESCCESCNVPVPTATAVETPVETTTPAPVATETASPGPVETETPAPVATETATPEPGATETATPEVVATETPLPTITEVPVATTTPEPVATETATPGPAATETAAPVATETPAPAATETSTPGPAATETATPGPEVTATEGPAVTATPTAGPAATATVTATAVVTATTTPVPSATTTAVVTATTTAVPTATRTSTPVPTVTSTPVPTQTVTPTPASTPFCGDGIVNGTEQCDTAAPAPQCPNSGGALQICALGCVCPCPGTVAFSGDAEAPESILDTGFTGIAHRAPIITNGDVTIDLNCAATSRPCGTCPVTGPIVNANAGNGKLDNQRCSNDPSLKCTATATCTAAANKCSGGTNDGAACTVQTCGAGSCSAAGVCVGGATPGSACCAGGFCRTTGTCGFYFGSALPLAAGGVSTCVVNQFKQPITGTANIESGDAATTAFLTSRVYNGITVDSPCPQCVGDASINVAATTGVCNGGPRNGFPCDANGTVPNRPDFGTTSLDCPPSPGGIIAALTIDLSTKTNTVVKTLTTESPPCGGAAGNRCLCDTCNNANADVCNNNTDCPDPAGPIGPICGGRRCLSGTNVGAACTVASQCPGSSCGKVGQATVPSGCTDNTTTFGFPNNHFDCSDPDLDGVGRCEDGPNDGQCSVASGHAQRQCTSDGECGGAALSCESVARACFLTGGGTFNAAADQGSDTLIAVGMADAPMNDVSHPTLGAVFCVGPTSASAINNVAGLPGPARVTIKGTATGLP